MQDVAQPRQETDDSERQVRRLIRAQGSVLVALSGGVDSSVVAILAAQELPDDTLAVTGVSPSLAGREVQRIQQMCERFGVRHETVVTHELHDEAYARNNPDRCYHCKSELYSTLDNLAKRRGFARVLDGTSADDLQGHRPGHAAAQQCDVLSPLLSVGANKSQIRDIARRLDLPNAERPSSPCLSSRVAYGLRVTPERLHQIDMAETYLRTLGFPRVRVRMHDAIARIEVPKDDIARIADNAEQISIQLRRLGFTYVTVDLLGLRSGSLLEILNPT